MKIYKVVGMMSGTSLDGVDVVYCIFKRSNNKWSYEIVDAENYQYTDYWRQRLENLSTKDAFTFVKTNVEYGHFLGRLAKDFISKNNIKPDIIASHGHTIFHQPDKKMTSQIGHGASIAAETGMAVVSDFRSLDLAFGGQGAPLVPIGDKMLFPEFVFCLNLGGFANISYDFNNKRIAYDICPCNIILNFLADELGYDCDYDGKIAASGNIDGMLLKELNELEYYHNKPPKSLGKEWFIKKFIPIIKRYDIPVKDKLRTVSEHIAIQISYAAKIYDSKKMLVTGGGAFNKFLLQRIMSNTNHQIIIPDDKIINYKEALIFAFLGVLRIRKEVNCLKSVTGAKRDNVGGAVYYV